MASGDLVMGRWRWGVPDWRAGCYPESLSPRGWRWEFLRRRPDYREDWLLHFASLGDEHAAEMPTRPDCDGSREKYRTAFLLDPTIDARQLEEVQLANLFMMEPPYGVRFTTPEGFDSYERQGVKLVAFDLNSPLEPQLKKAKRHLEAVQADQHEPARSRAHVAKWPLYLRVIDARDDGASWSEIAAHILSDRPYEAPEQRASTLYTQAREAQERHSLTG